MSSFLSSITLNYKFSAVSKDILKISLNDVLKGFKNGFLNGKLYYEQLETIRACKDKESRDELKSNLPSIYFSVTFTGKEKRYGANKFSKTVDECIHEYTGITMMDIDLKENPGIDLEAAKKYFMAQDCVIAVIVSPSGTGLKVIYRIAKVSYKIDYKIIFNSIANMIKNDTGIVIDSRCSNPNRFHYFTIDNNVYVNENAIEYILDESERKTLQDIEPVNNLNSEPLNLTTSYELTKEIEKILLKLPGNFRHYLFSYTTKQVREYLIGLNGNRAYEQSFEGDCSQVEFSLVRYCIHKLNLSAKEIYSIPLAREKGKRVDKFHDPDYFYRTYNVAASIPFRENEVEESELNDILDSKFSDFTARKRNSLKLLYKLLCTYSHYQYYKLDCRTMSEKTGLHHATINRYLHTLRNLGMITIDESEYKNDVTKSFIIKTELRHVSSRYSTNDLYNYKNIPKMLIDQYVKESSSINEIVEKTGYCKRTIIKHLNELSSRGLFTYDSTGMVYKVDDYIPTYYLKAELKRKHDIERSRFRARFEASGFVSATKTVQSKPAYIPENSNLTHSFFTLKNGAVNLGVGEDFNHYEDSQTEYTDRVDWFHASERSKYHLRI